MAKRELKKQDAEGLPALFAKAADDVTELLDVKLALLKAELREEAETFIRGGTMIAIGGIVAAVGFALLNVAIAFLVSTLFQSTSLSQPARYALGFIITAVVYLAIGTALIIVNKNKMAAQGLVPKRSVAELKRDKERLEEEI